MASLNDIDNILGDGVIDDNVKIDIESLNSESIEYSQKLMDDVTALFQDDEWVQCHPQVSQRLNIELETLRGLVKMRRADEFAHDALLKAIGNDNSCASLYRSLADIQKTSLNITTKINETISIINNLMKGFQLDLPLTPEIPEGEFKEDDGKIWRGSKDFIKSMNEED